MMPLGMTLTRRRANLCRAIKLAYSSSKTHFYHSIVPPKKTDWVGDALFNATAIREYAEIMLICACELEQLAKAEKRETRKSGK